MSDILGKLLIVPVLVIAGGKDRRARGTESEDYGLHAVANFQVRHLGYALIMLHFYRASFGFVLLAGFTFSAQTLPENEPYCEKSSRRVDVADADLAILGLAVGRSSLKDVQAKLGNAVTTRASREEESDVSVCYVSPTDGSVLIFYSGAMGGWEDVTWFGLWSHDAAFPGFSRCTPSKLVSRRLATESGLQLDLTRDQVEKIVGKPTKLRRTSINYEYLCRRKMTDAEIEGFMTHNGWDVRKYGAYFDRMSWIDVHFKNSTASRIEIGRIESY